MTDDITVRKIIKYDNLSFGKRERDGERVKTDEEHVSERGGGGGGEKVRKSNNR